MRTLEKTSTVARGGAGTGNEAGNQIVKETGASTAASSPEIITAA